MYEDEYISIMSSGSTLDKTERIRTLLLANPKLLVSSVYPKDSTPRVSILAETIDSGLLEIADFILKGYIRLCFLPENATPDNINSQQIIIQPCTNTNHHWRAYWLENNTPKTTTLSHSVLQNIAQNWPSIFQTEKMYWYDQGIIKNIALKLNCLPIFWQNRSFLEQADPFFCGEAEYIPYGLLSSAIINIYYALITLEYHQEKNKINDIMIQQNHDVGFIKSYYNFLYWIDPDTNKKKPVSFQPDEECDITSAQIAQYEQIDTFFYMKIAHRALQFKNIINDTNASKKRKSDAFEALGDFYLHISHMESYYLTSLHYALKCALESYLCSKQISSSKRIDQKIAHIEHCIKHEAKLYHIQFAIQKEKNDDIKKIDRDARQTKYIADPENGVAIEITETSDDGNTLMTRYIKSQERNTDGQDDGLIKKIVTPSRVEIVSNPSSLYSVSLSNNKDNSFSCSIS